MEISIVEEFSSLNVPCWTASGCIRGSGAATPRERRLNLRRDVAANGLDALETLLEDELEDRAFAIDDTDSCAAERLLPVDRLVGGQLDISQLVSKERELLSQRVDLCFKVQQESTRITDAQCSQREAARRNMIQERRRHLGKLASAQRCRDERWAPKLHDSPFATNLVAESKRFEEVEEQRRRKPCVQSIPTDLKGVTPRGPSEADKQRQRVADRRESLEKERRQRALRTLEKANGRTALMAEQARAQQLQEQELAQKQLDQAFGLSRRPQAPSPQST
eukprot:TRINITY_DN57929_c0_g1_i1.p1 TRINITY_DN57929_c0_g1~~TRINITY_DN57929_c0_g1_i1.p1  ORF type:complete len:279 (-),score=44.96 TRINITY_DN57929_c0_g1_i1:122-958(-)